RFDVALATVIAKAAQSQNSRPRRQRAGVMRSALGLVPRISPRPVISRANVGDALDTLLDHARIDHVTGGGIFETGPPFGVIGKWHLGTFTAAVIRDDQRGLVVQRERPLDGVVFVERSLVVVAIDALERGTAVLRI